MFEQRRRFQALTIKTEDGEPLVEVRLDGEVVFTGEAYDVVRKLVGILLNVRSSVGLLATHAKVMERLLEGAGKADLAYEKAQLKAKDGGTEHDRFMEEISRRNLEVAVHQLIEFARGLALRPAESQEPPAKKDLN